MQTNEAMILTTQQKFKEYWRDVDVNPEMTINEAWAKFHEDEIEALEEKLKIACDALTEIRNNGWGTDHCDGNNMAADEALEKINSNDKLKQAIDTFCDKKGW